LRLTGGKQLATKKEDKRHDKIQPLRRGKKMLPPKSHDHTHTKMLTSEETNKIGTMYDSEKKKTPDIGQEHTDELDRHHQQRDKQRNMGGK